MKFKVLKVKIIYKRFIVRKILKFKDKENFYM